MRARHARRLGAVADAGEVEAQTGVTGPGEVAAGARGEAPDARAAVAAGVEEDDRGPRRRRENGRDGQIGEGDGLAGEAEADPVIPPTLAFKNRGRRRGDRFGVDHR